jgi:hypothetical protein
MQQIIIFFFTFTQHQTLLEGIKGKGQITDHRRTEQRAKENKSRLLQQILGNRYSSEQVDDSPGRRRILREFYIINKILIGNFN